MQTRYQYGTLTLRKRKAGPDVWQWRYMEAGRRKSVLIGTTERLPNKAAAIRALESRRVKLNADNPQTPFRTITVSALIDRYVAEELDRVRHDTQVSYRSFLNKWIRPKWGSVVLAEVKTVPVEGWLAAIPRSPQTRGHIRNMFHVLFQSAMRWDLTDRNPISLVRQSTARRTIPRILTPKEFKALLKELTEPYRTMVLVAGCLGLRASELMGLQWGDVDWDNLTVFIRRSASGKHVYDTKTEQSSKPVPLDPSLAEVLLRHKENSKYKNSSDFVFAGDSGQPRWRGILFADHIKPASEKAGIGKLGWHTFRHSFSTLLHGLGTDLAVQKELLRHADIKTTMNVYTQAMAPAKRKAIRKLTQKLLEA
ncbi:MAG TPA: site-specific integrase [Candidatus Acidoferrum sp.]|nr:site-specific integrase [Candidatus Acidoferrum sp.]